MKVRLGESNSDRVRSLSERFGISLLFATILDRRGIDNEELKFVFEDDFLYEHNPFQSDEIYSAVERINEAIENGERIAIFGDRDTDGITATAILVKGFRKLGYDNLFWALPEGDDNYGLTDNAIDRIKASGATLLITVDNGITAVKEIGELQNSGIDVILTDHHIPALTLPPALSIIDPKIEGNGYPEENLAGCAVASKLLYALFLSRTDLYNSRIILLHAEPGNETISIGAVKLENLMEIGRIREEILIGGKNTLQLERLSSFLGSSTPIGVFDRSEELSLLRKAFPKNTEISLIELKGEISKVIKVGNRSLFDLSKRSRGALYSSKDMELDTLISLYKTVALRTNENLSKGFDEFSQLRAIGTIADLMPLTGENRLIVRQGLKRLSERPIKTLLPLLSRQNLLLKPVSSRDVSFKIAPIINAAGRLGKADVALSLLLSDDESEINRLTDQLFDLNSERHRKEEELMSLIKGAAHSSFMENDEKIVIVEDDRIPRGLTGVMANRLQAEYQVPIMVIAYTENRLSGSMRSPEGFDARSFLSDFSPLFDDFGGHKNAAGFSLPIDNREEFLKSVKSRIETFENSGEKDQEIEVDLILPEKYMNDELWDLSDKMEPYGQENPPLRIYISSAEILEAHTLSGNQKYMGGTVKYGLYGWPFVWFNTDDRSKYRAGAKVDIVFSPGISFYRGERRKQLQIFKMDAVVD